jgi:hypothetical protein
MLMHAEWLIILLFSLLLGSSVPAAGSAAGQGALSQACAAGNDEVCDEQNEGRRRDSEFVFSRGISRRFTSGALIPLSLPGLTRTALVRPSIMLRASLDRPAFHAACPVLRI